MDKREQSLREKWKSLTKIGAYTFSDLQHMQFLQLIALLDKWNKTYNLTAVRDPEEMLTKHLLDSLAVGKYLQGKRFIDVGTGAGFPGLPLAIAYPCKQFTLLDSQGKRIQFIRHVIRELGLTNVTPILSRVETYRPEETFDGVLSRAFASLKDMTNWCHHLLSSQGYFYALKGHCNADEIKAISKDFYIEKSLELHIPMLVGERHLILIKNN